MLNDTRVSWIEHSPQQATGNALAIAVQAVEDHFSNIQPPTLNVEGATCGQPVAEI